MRLSVLAFFLATPAFACQTIAPAPTGSSYNAAVLGVPQYQCVRNWYVSNSGSNSNSGTSVAQAWKDIQYANENHHGQLPGDCVNIVSGSYSNTYGGGAIYMELPDESLATGNSPTGYFVMRAVDSSGNYAPGTVTITGVGGAQTIKMMQPYQIIDGLVLNCNNQGNGTCVGNADEIAGVNNGHHLVIENSTIYGANSASVEFHDGEYQWVVNNKIYNNTGANAWFSGGVLITTPLDETHGGAQSDPMFTPNAIDLALSYRIVVANNAIYNNTGAGSSFGMGITLDSFDSHTQHQCSGCGTPTNVVYPHASLVAGNFVYGNGNTGILVDYAGTSPITVGNNTTYGNNAQSSSNGPDGAKAEALNMHSTAVTWVNNIFSAVPGSTGNIAAFNDGGAVQFLNNLTFNGTAGQASTSGSGLADVSNKLGVNPQLTNPSGGVFTLQAGSPAYAAGAPVNYITGTPSIGAAQ